MDLLLEMCNTRSIHWCGISGQQLGKLSPGASLSLPLAVFSSVQGLQVPSKLSRFYLVCFLSFNPILHLFVSECLRTEAHRHVSEEDVRVR